MQQPSQQQLPLHMLRPLSQQVHTQHMAKHLSQQLHTQRILLQLSRRQRHTQHMLQQANPQLHSIREPILWQMEMLHHQVRTHITWRSSIKTNMVFLVPQQQRAHLQNFIAGTPEAGWYDSLDQSRYRRQCVRAPLTRNSLSHANRAAQCIEPGVYHSKIRCISVHADPTVHCCVRS